MNKQVIGNFGGCRNFFPSVRYCVGCLLAVTLLPCLSSGGQRVTSFYFWWWAFDPACKHSDYSVSCFLTESWACATAPFTLSVSCVGMGSPLRHCPRWRKLPSSPVFYMPHLFGGPDICWGPLSTGVILEESAATPVPLVIGRVIWVNGGCGGRSLVSGALVASDAHVLRQFSRLLQKGLIICVLESILFFFLLRMIVILFKNYYFNDNIFIYMTSLQIMCTNNHLSHYINLILQYY